MCGAAACWPEEPPYSLPASERDLREDSKPPEALLAARRQLSAQSAYRAAAQTGGVSAWLPARPRDPESRPDSASVQLSPQFSAARAAVVRALAASTAWAAAARTALAA